MDKRQAKQALAEGKKITHTYMLEEEYVYELNGKIYDENGCHLPDFWFFRETPVWDKGYSIVA